MERTHTEQKYYLEDGRKAERRIVEDGLTRVTEIYEETDRPKKLSKRIIEKLEPAVCERTVETIDEHGNVVNSTTEVVEPSQMVIKESSLTREDVSLMIVDAVSAITDATRRAPQGVTGLSAGAIVQERLGSAPKSKTKKIIDWALFGIIAFEVAVLGYLLYPKILLLIQ